MRQHASLAFVLGLALAGVSHADVIYGNFGSGNTFATGSGSFIDQHPSISFVSASNQLVGEVDIAAYLNGSDSTVTISLSADSSGHPGASALASGSVTATVDPSVLQWILGTPQSLSSGTTYWVTLSVATQDSVVWNYNNQFQAGDSRFISGVWAPEPNDTQGAIQVLTGQASQSATPEPGTWLLFASATGMLAMGRRRSATDLRK